MRHELPRGGRCRTVHQTTIDGITLCTDEPFTDEEMAALREYFAGSAVSDTDKEGKQ